MLLFLFHALTYMPNDLEIYLLASIYYVMYNSDYHSLAFFSRVWSIF
jgi:hypothetical protein